MLFFYFYCAFCLFLFFTHFIFYLYCIFYWPFSRTALVSFIQKLLTEQRNSYNISYRTSLRKSWWSHLRPSKWSNDVWKYGWETYRRQAESGYRDVIRACWISRNKIPALQDFDFLADLERPVFLLWKRILLSFHHMLKPCSHPTAHS